MNANRRPAGAAASTSTPPSATVRNVGTFYGFSSPIYRGRLNHGAAAELQEGYRILTDGQKVNYINAADFFKVVQASGVHATEEEMTELLRVVHQDDRTAGLHFSEFLLLMTKEVDDGMREEMLQVFRPLDPNSTGHVTKKQFTELFVSGGENSSSEELEELLSLADAPEGSDSIDYMKFIAELAVRLNKM